MKTLSVSDFREQCLHLIDVLPAEGILITKRGHAVAKVIPLPRACADLIGSVKGIVSDSEDGLFSTGDAWDVESGHSYSDQSARRKPKNTRARRRYRGS